jgi:hypothetical protein
MLLFPNRMSIVTHMQNAKEQKKKMNSSHPALSIPSAPTQLAPFTSSILTSPSRFSNSLCLSSKNLASASNGSFGCSRASIFIPSSSAGVTLSFRNLLAGAPPGGIWFAGVALGVGDNCFCAAGGCGCCGGGAGGAGGRVCCGCCGGGGAGFTCCCCCWWCRYP